MCNGMGTSIYGRWGPTNELKQFLVQIHTFINTMGPKFNFKKIIRRMYEDMEKH